MESNHCQDKGPVSLGDLVSMEREGRTWILRTRSGLARVTVMTPDIVRIRIVKEAFTDSFSYVVVGQEQACAVKAGEEKDQMVLETDSLVLKIRKQPVRFAFYTKDGQLISTDDPGLGTTWVGDEVTTFKQLQDGERFIGLGEKTGNLDRRGEGYTNWNTDNPRYGAYDDPLYASVPFYIGIHHRLLYGIYFDNTHRTQFNFGASNDRFSSFTADDGEMDYYFIHHSSVAKILESYTWLTGRMELPPLWSLGYQQCRWSYFPDSEVLSIAKTFREKKIPADVMYLDIHYMDAYKIFTWHPQRFPDPAGMTEELRKLGFHTTVIVDPGIKVEKGYPAYEEGIKNNFFLKYPDKQDYTAMVWPGWCHFPDFSNPVVRTWWGSEFKGYVEAGVEGFWNDMNEIASWGGGLSPSVLHFDWDGRGATYRQAKNIYGMLMARSTYEGTKKLLAGKRPLILTRAGFAGLQRYTAIWTGDNHATDEHMLLGVRLINSFGLSGIAFTGCDVGGFQGEASRELYSRWVSIGAFSPFFRGHTHYSTRSSEPWSYGEEAEDIARNYITLRYRLLPYIYSAFYEATLTGMPVQRSLAIGQPFDEHIFHYAYQNQYMFGPALMVAPVESSKTLTKVYLPEGDWYDLYNDKKYNGNIEIYSECPLDRLPVFVKGGSIIPVQSPVQSTSESSSDTLFLHVYKGLSGSEYVYYEDDGTTYAYSGNSYYRRQFSLNTAQNILILDKPEGGFRSKFRWIRLMFHGFDLKAGTVAVNGVPVRLEQVGFSFLQALDEKDPQWIGNSQDKPAFKSLLIENTDKMIHIDLQ